jgi:hypothetical protein
MMGGEGFVGHANKHTRNKPNFWNNTTTNGTNEISSFAALLSVSDSPLKPPSPRRGKKNHTHTLTHTDVEKKTHDVRAGDACSSGTCV